MFDTEKNLNVYIKGFRNDDITLFESLDEIEVTNSRMFR